MAAETVKRIWCGALALALFLTAVAAGAEPAGLPDVQNGGLQETVKLYVEQAGTGDRFYTNPVYDRDGKQVGMHNYTLDAAGGVLDESYQTWNGRITGVGVYLNYRSDNHRNGTKIVVGKDGKSTTYWWDNAGKKYTGTNPTGGKYSKMKYVKEIAAEQRNFDRQSGVLTLQTVLGADGAR